MINKKTLFTVLTIALCVLFIEIILSATNIIQKGQVNDYDNFSSFDTLQLHTIYSTDEVGILRIDPVFLQSFKENLSITKKDSSIYFADNIANIFYEFNELKRFLNSNNTHNLQENQFVKFVFEELGNSNEFVSALTDYINFPFNSDGFRSIDFCKTIGKDKVKVMLVGDSFVWGMSAQPYYNSFADLLITKGYVVYNMGIIGTDPAQYEAIIKKYAPIINPDIIITNFYEGNDYMSFRRKPKADEPLEHFTNIGFLDSHPLGVYLSPEESFEFYKKLNTIPVSPKNTFNVICSKTCLGTLIWRILFKINIVQHKIYDEYYSFQNKSRVEKASISKEYLLNISNYCNNHNYEHIFVSIPEKPVTFIEEFLRKYFNNDIEEARKTVFKDIEYFMPQNLTKAHYETGSGSHFVNSGALKYTDFLDSLIQVNLNTN